MRVRVRKMLVLGEPYWIVELVPSKFAMAINGARPQIEEAYRDWSEAIENAQTLLERKFGSTKAYLFA